MSNPEQEVVITIKLSDAMFGSDEERGVIRNLTNQLTDAISDSEAGYLDGDSYGNGEAEIFAYGPDAKWLFTIMEPHLRAFKMRPAHAVLHLGAVDDADAPEQRIDL
jgi:hypothetical protein